MKGKIVIEAKNSGQIGVDVEMEHLNGKDILVLVDSLVESLDIDDMFRIILGRIIMSGGLKKVEGAEITKIMVPRSKTE